MVSIIPAFLPSSLKIQSPNHMFVAGGWEEVVSDSLLFPSQEILHLKHRGAFPIVRGIYSNGWYPKNPLWIVNNFPVHLDNYSGLISHYLDESIRFIHS